MWPTLLVACSSLIIAARAGCSWNSKDEYLNLGVNRGGCFACESLADDTDALVEYCRAICLADSSCKSFEIAAGSEAFYFYGTAVNCCIEYADSTDTGPENFWISADDAGTCADEVSLWTTYEPDDIAACELDEGLDSSMCDSALRTTGRFPGMYESYEPENGAEMAILCGTDTGCSQAWCRSKGECDGGDCGPRDCWAGTKEEECSCHEGKARETGAKREWNRRLQVREDLAEVYSSRRLVGGSSDPTYEYEYTCCTDGTGDGPRCGECCDSSGSTVAIVFAVLVPCFCMGICVFRCWRSKSCCFQHSGPQQYPQQFQQQYPQQFQQQAAPGYGQQPGIVMGQMPQQQGVVQTGVVMSQQQGPVVMGQPQLGVVMAQPQTLQGSVIQGTAVRSKEVSLAGDLE